MFRRIPFGRQHSQDEDAAITQLESRSYLQRSPTEATNATRSSLKSVTEAGSLGLNVVYTPLKDHIADIVFVHGLGGTSHHTWSKSKDPELFWPLKFLPDEPDICRSRILTFGYDSTFHKGGNANASILDFAKDLLYDLKFGKDEEKEDLNMGRVPLIFIVHSMGGLVIKEAYIQGQHDSGYESIIKAITAIAFLATPHRGTNLAQTLNRILQSTLVSSAKQYISELNQNSLTLQKLNEQFRHIAPKLDIVSFYETIPTSVGLKNTRFMVLEKETSILGYPGELSKALKADHHGVCKFDSPDDPNYVTVRNMLQSLVRKLIATSRPIEEPASGRRRSFDLKALLAISELPMMDFSFYRDQWAEGTSDWILQDKAYLNWRHSPELSPRLLWLNGGPATGKSVLASFIINSLAEENAQCQYFFIRFEDRKKRTLSCLLRSLAYQLARAVPGFLERLLELVDEAIPFETADARVIWERIYKSILLNMNVREPLFWVIDGMDEADDPRALLKLLFSMSNASIPLRILLIGRKTSDLTSTFLRAPSNLNLVVISLDGRKDDLRSYVKQELDIPGSADFRDMIEQRIFETAEGNFLWVRLAVDTVNRCHRDIDVEAALQDLPVGMEALYDRMATLVVQHPSQKDRELASTILQYVTCSVRLLTAAELSEALGSDDTAGMLDFQRSVIDLCGGFAILDNSGNVSMMHQTAREYLLSGEDRPFSVDRHAANKQIFSSCMRCLMTVGLRAKLKGKQVSEFLDYAARMWSVHLSLTPVGCRETIGILTKFLTGHWVLTWIHYLAVTKQLRHLIQASRSLSRYSAKYGAHGAEDNGGSRIMEQELLDSWVVDLVKVVGKFGNILRQNPESIYKLVPPFCPRSSSIYQHFGKPEERQLAVSGLSAERWDDSLARISLKDGAFASSIAAAGSMVAVFAASGTVYLRDSTTFEESPVGEINHGERVYMFILNTSATLIATYGYRTTKIWDSSTGELQVSVPNLASRPRPLAMLFAEKGKRLLVGTDDGRIRSLDTSQTSQAWQTVADLDEPELEGHFLNAANYMAIAEDGKLTAIAYRGHPFSAWETPSDAADLPQHIGHCWRKRDPTARGEVISAAWLPYSSLSPEILGLYIEGVVFKWSPYDNEVEEMAVGASHLAVSKDGRLFATGDGKGTIKVLTTAGFGLIYQLASQDAVFGIAFSPNSHRFYDIKATMATYGSPMR